MVLIIDDEYALQEVITEILELSDIPVMTAGNGKTGIALLAEHSDKICAVFLDLHLPDMTGFAAFCALREISPLLDVVIMSGQPEVLAMQEFNGQKHLWYLEKPFTLDVLMERVDAVLTRTSI